MTDKIMRIKHLVKELNVYRDEYYNNSNSIISDYEYDKLFDELKSLEDETGFITSNSPTRTVGYEINSDFPTVLHNPPLLSLDKTQSIDEFVKFCQKSPTLLMHKLDGLTVRLRYDNGKLIQACTRGNGIEGSDITTNAKYFSNIPLSVTNKNRFYVDGEAIITYDVFNKINSNSTETKKTPRNLASSIATLKDTSVVNSREIKFICWNANQLSTDGNMESGLLSAKDLGFDIVDYFIPIDDLSESVPLCVEKLQSSAEAKFIPIDGVVAVYNDIAYGESLGKTEHHFRNGYAFKFYEEEKETIITDVEWSIGKTGELTPVAIFNSVELDGTSVSRASLHNISIIKEQKIGIGDSVTVYKALQIIPQIRDNLTKSNSLIIPDKCPICGSPTEIKTNYSNSLKRNVETLHCTNTYCRGKMLYLLEYYCSKNAMDIEGLSEATIEDFIQLGILNSFTDIYNIYKHKERLYELEGYGKKSIDKLIESIEKSKTTTLNRFINALSIPTIGKANAKTLSEFIDNDSTRIFELADKDLTVINGFGAEMNLAVHNWFANKSNVEMLKALLTYLNFEEIDMSIVTKLVGLNFVITGKVNKYKSRSDLESVILHNGGTVQSSVTSTTNYLINNDSTSTSSKNKKAMELNIPIINEEQFIAMINPDESTAKDLTNQALSSKVSSAPTKGKLF